MREYAREVDVVVDAKKIPDLSRIELSAETGLTLGAAVPCYQIYGHADISAAYPGLTDSASIIGGTAIQGRASIGGNLCNSGPAADSIPTLIAYGAVANIAGPGGQRQTPVESFCTAPGRNVLQAGEILVSIHLPVQKARSGARYLRFIPRNEMDIAEVGVGAWVQLNAAGSHIEAARIGLGAVGPTPIFASAAGDSLAGKAVGSEALAEASALAEAAASPITDMRGTAEHRRHLVGVLTRRALTGAIERARA